MSLIKSKRKGRPLFGVPAPGFALHDPRLAIPSIFRPVCQGRRPGFDLTLKFGGLSVQLTCFEWPDARDQSVLLALCAMAGLSSQKIAAESPDQIGQQNLVDLEPSSEVTTSYYELRDAAGLKSHDTNDAEGYQRLIHILYRLSQVGCRAHTDDGYDWSMILLGFASTPDGGITVTLNERFAAALAGKYTKA